MTWFFLSLFLYAAAIGVLAVFAIRLTVAAVDRFLLHGHARLITRSSVAWTAVAVLVFALQTGRGYDQVRRESAIRAAAIDGATMESVLAKLGPPDLRYRQWGMESGMHSFLLYQTPDWWLAPGTFADDYLLEFDSDGHFVNWRIDK